MSRLQQPLFSLISPATVSERLSLVASYNGVAAGLIVPPRVEDNDEDDDGTKGAKRESDSTGRIYSNMDCF